MSLYLFSQLVHFCLKVHIVTKHSTMKNTSFVILIISIFASQTKAQLNIIHKEKAFLFYQTPNIKKLPFVFKGNAESLNWFTSNQNTNALFSIKIDSSSSNTLYGAFEFSKNIDARDFRFILRTLQQDAFYLNNIKILRQSLFSEQELKDSKYTPFTIDKTQSNAATLKSANSILEALYNAKKTNYPKLLYSGKITELEEKYSTLFEKR